MRWNIGLIAVEAALVCWAHAVGVSWLALGLLFAGLALVAGSALTYFFRVHVPRAQRRYERQLRIALAQHALPVHARAVQSPAHSPSTSDRGAA
jgi:hypothetical protein